MLLLNQKPRWCLFQTWTFPELCTYSCISWTWLCCESICRCWIKLPERHELTLFLCFAENVKPHSHHKSFGSSVPTPAHQSNVGSHCGPWPAGGSPPLGPAPDESTSSPHCLMGRSNVWPQPAERDRAHPTTKITAALKPTRKYREESSELHAGDLEKCIGWRYTCGVVSWISSAMQSSLVCAGSRS